MRGEGWLIRTLLAGLMLGVTVTVTQANSPQNMREGTGIIQTSLDTIQSTQLQPRPGATFHPQVVVKISDTDEKFTHRDGFKTEAECVAYIGSEQFVEDLQDLAVLALSQDPTAHVVGEPACVERAAPSRGI